MKCYNCSYTNLKLKYLVSGHKLYRCQRCNLLFTKFGQKRSLQRINKIIYSGLYIQNYIVRSSELIVRFRKRLKEIENYKHGGKILDVGCGIGLFLSIVNKYGNYKWNLSGIDINSGLIKYGRNIIKAKYYLGQMTSINFREEKYDCITCFDVLEHSYNIKENLGKIKQILKPNGLLVIQIPNYKSIMTDITKDDWDWWNVPDHVLHFEPRTIDGILRKNGFEIIKLFTWDSKQDFILNVKARIKKIFPTLLSINRITGSLTEFLLSLSWPLTSAMLRTVSLGGLIVVYAKMKDI